MTSKDDDLVERVARAIISAGYNPATARDIAQIARPIIEREALEKAARLAKVAWLNDVGTLGDADYGSALCEQLSDAIRALISREEEGKP